MKRCAGILIGGRSRRMGTAKALIRADGVTLLERTAAVAARAADEVVLLGAAHFNLPEGVQSMPHVEDLHPGIGPIGGLEAILTARPDCTCLLLACDMPHLSESVLVRLHDELGEADAAVCETGEDDTERLHPCCAIYQPRILPVVRQAIETGRYGMMQLLVSLNVRRLMLSAADARCVANWNEPGDIPGSACES